MKPSLVVALCVFAISEVGFAKGSRGLYAGPGTLSPMEERLEGISAQNAASRAEKAAKARQKIQRNIPAAQSASGGTKVRYVKVTKKCPCEKKTFTATGGAKVGVGKTPSAAKAAASGARATNKATW